MLKLRCTQILIAEHRAAERQLIKLQISIEDAPPHHSGSAVANETPEQSAEAFRTHLTLHLRKEDDGLFPLLERVFPGEASPLVVMSKEHDKINEAYERLLLSLSAPNRRNPAAGAGLSEPSRNIRFLLQVTLAHFGKEEEILFPAAELHLTEEEDQSIVQKWEEFSGNSSSSSRAEVNVEN